MNVVLALIGLLACFYVLAIITEDFFIPSIDIIAKKLKLSSDASGATLLAMGSSAPEFFTSLIAVLGLAGAHQADIGTGTIVGSAIFNILVIVGAVAMYRTATLQWKPVIRDLIFYIITIFLLLVAFSDGRIVLLEAVVFVLFYLFYVVTAVKWRKWFKYDDYQPNIDVSIQSKSNLRKITHKTLQFIIPPPDGKNSLFITTFAVSIIGIAGLSWLLVSQVVVIATAFSVNSTFLALTVLAAGTSIPDLIGSVVVAKQGRGDMAVSNAVGSNIFDILFGLGLPWIIALAVRPGHIAVGTANLTASILLLFATVIAILFILIVRKWRIGSKSGLILISLYVAYCVYIASSVAGK